MKKIIKKLICVMLIATFSFTAFGCTGKTGQQGGGNPNADQTLTIYALNRGYGIKWLEELEKMGVRLNQEK